MPVIKPTCVRDLKMRVNLADVVSRVVTLRKAGSGGRLKGLCPFHNEKSPSFHVDADKGFYKCFGCGKAGDAITTLPNVVLSPHHAGQTPEVIRDGLLLAVQNVDNFVAGRPTNVVVAPVK